jgi:hypothetical protein
MESLEQFFKDNQRGYPRDPRRMAYAKLQKNTQGMDREQLEAFITANLFIPHSQYKMALGNLIQFLKKQDQMNKLNEVKQFQKIAGLINENWHPDDPASVDMDDIEDEDPEDFDDVSEDADYESESGDTNAIGDTDAMNINEDEETKKRQEYAKYVNGFISQNEEDLNNIYETQGYLAALKVVRDKVAAILHNAGKYEYPTAGGGIGDNFPLVDAITRLFKQMGYKKK